VFDVNSRSDPRIAVLISGGGRTLKNLIELRAFGQLQAEIGLVISSHAQAAGLEFARRADIPTLVVDHKQFDVQEASRRIFSAIESSGAQWVVLGGFIRRLVIEPRWSNRVVNIHPALVPAFAGQGFFGQKVHEAVLAYGCKISGCTVHFVDNQYDHGPIIAQQSVPVMDDDTPKTLGERVFAMECQLYPRVIHALVSGAIRVSDRRVSIDWDDDMSSLSEQSS
jgi:phosphoribosylglycinamide formyltransferase-1